MTLDAQSAFERDLERWLAEVYLQLERLGDAEERCAIERVLERQNRLFIGLTVLLAAGMALVPFFGERVLLGALATLYGVSFVSSAATVTSIKRLERSAARRRELAERRDMAWRTRPAMGADERALLIRVMNLSRLFNTATGRAALARELSELQNHPLLGSWPALRDAAALTREPLAPPDP